MTVTRTLLLSLALVAAAGARAEAEDAAVPRDFRLVAQYGPGLTAWKPWTLTIDAGGDAVQDTYAAGSPKVTKAFTVSADDLASLVKLIGEAGFFQLAGTYSYDVADNPILILRVTLNEATHEVTVYAPGHLRANDEVTRFLRVWNQILTAVPSPNPEQRPL